MAGARVDVDHYAAMGRQQIAYRDQALAQASEVAREVGPAVVERRR